MWGGVLNLCKFIKINFFFSLEKFCGHVFKILAGFLGLTFQIVCYLTLLNTLPCYRKHFILLFFGLKLKFRQIFFLLLLLLGLFGGGCVSALLKWFGKRIRHTTGDILRHFY